MLRERETPGVGVIGTGDPGRTSLAQAKMAREGFIGKAGARNVLLTAARFFLGGWVTKNANFGEESISRITEGIIQVVQVELKIK